jgi:hypothetical protein
VYSITVLTGVVHCTANRGSSLLGFKFGIGLATNSKYKVEKTFFFIFMSSCPEMGFKVQK